MSVSVNIPDGTDRHEVNNVIDSTGAGSAGPPRPWPAAQIEHWPIERLIPYANNPRLHSQADLDKIAASIDKWGWTNPVLVDEQGVVIAGHGRVDAAARLGLKTIPVIVARGWSEDGEAGLSHRRQ